MNRYERIEIERNTNGKRFKKTVKYPEIPADISDIYIIGTVGDRLDNLAHKYYKDARYWWIIARANNIGKGDLTVPIGSQIRIPINFIQIIDNYNQLNR
jgi:nucleoid-associated protein YgaU